MLTELLVTGFFCERFSLDLARTPTQAIAKARARRPQVFVIALALAPVPLEELCQAVRSQNNVDVLLVGAAPQVDTGSADSPHTPDGYLTKPVTFRSTLFFIYEILKRRNSNLAAALRAGDILMDRRSQRVECHGHEVNLTPCEFTLLELFLLHPGQVFSRETLFARVWGYDYYGGSNAVGVSVGNLRCKLGQCGSYLRTVKEAGYALLPPDSRFLVEDAGHTSEPVPQL